MGVNNKSLILLTTDVGLHEHSNFTTQWAAMTFKTRTDITHETGGIKHTELAIPWHPGL
jgi:hypothetical protein